MRTDPTAIKVRPKPPPRGHSQRSPWPVRDLKDLHAPLHHPRNRDARSLLTRTLWPRDSHPDANPQCGTTICLPVIAPLAKIFCALRAHSFLQRWASCRPRPAPKDLSSGLLLFFRKGLHHGPARTSRSAPAFASNPEAFTRTPLLTSYAHLKN
jgi:hypothetical protein